MTRLRTRTETFSDKSIAAVLRATCLRCLRPVREHTVSELVNALTMGAMFVCPTDRVAVTFGEMMMGGYR